MTSEVSLYIRTAMDGIQERLNAIQDIEEVIDQYKITKLVVLGFLDNGMAANAPDKEDIVTGDVFWEYMDIPKLWSKRDAEVILKHTKSNQGMPEMHSPIIWLRKRLEQNRQAIDIINKVIGN